MPAPPFFKGHALGNDYLVIARESLARPLAADLVRRLCDRHRGIGADGIVEIVDETSDDISVVVWNPDGGIAEVSGNGLRIAALWLARNHSPGWKKTLLSGGRRYPITDCEGGQIAIALPAARVVAREISLSTVSGDVIVTVVDVGNPHAVITSDGVGREHFFELAPLLARHPHFPAGVNLEWIGPHHDGAISIEIFERGVGRTSASGTGACAAATAAIALQLVGSTTVTVVMVGGEVSVTSEATGLTLRGPVQALFEGRMAAHFLGPTAT